MRRFSRFLALSILICGINVPNGVAGWGSYDAESFVDWDPFVTSILCGEFLSPATEKAHFSLDGYSYASSPGIVMNAEGFVPSVYWERPGLRKITLHGRATDVTRSIREAEIDEVRLKARQAVLESYEELIQSEIRKWVDQIESEIPPSLVSFGVVRQDSSGKIVGVVRIVNGAAREGKVRLPAFDILRAQGKLTAADEAKLLTRFNYHGKSGGGEGLGVPVEEIGQFYIDKSLSAADREAVRSRLLLWIYSNHLATSISPNGVKIVHTSRLGHYELWSRAYGFSDVVLEKTNSAGTTESVAAVASDLLGEKIKAILKPH